MHVQTSRSSSRPPLAAAVVALFASVVGVAHAVEFEEQVKAPQARNAEQLRLIARVASTEFADASLEQREVVVRDAARARRQFDARWTVLHALETRAPLGDLREFGIVPDERGSVHIDLGRYPQWDDFCGRITRLLSQSSIEVLRADLTQRGMTDADVNAIQEYVSGHDAAAMRRQAALPVALGFARVVKKHDKIKRPVPNDAVIDFLYQSDASTAEAERAWLAGLLDSLDPHAARILLSYLGELGGTAVWSPSDMDAIVRDRLTTLRSPDFERRARAEAAGGAP
jgi:hypothetical protein